MLAIRLKRTGRKGHAQYKVVVQDSRFSPKSGRVVYYLGDYNPHTKQANIDKEAGEKYLKNGAQPSDRAAEILKAAGVKLPKWYVTSPKQEKSIRNPEKLRKNRPAGEPAPVESQAPVEPDESVEAPADETSSEDSKPEDSQSEEDDSPDTTPAESESEEPSSDETSDQKENETASEEAKK